MAVTTGRIHASDNVIFVNGEPTCTCHFEYDTALVFSYIDGIELPEAIELKITEHFKAKRGMLVPQIIDVAIKLTISRRIMQYNVNVSVDRAAYGIIFNQMLYERNSFLHVVRRLFMQLKDQVAASEMFAIVEAIAVIARWIERGNQLVEHDRLRELIKWAIDDAYRTGPQGPVNAP